MSLLYQALLKNNQNTSTERLAQENNNVEKKDDHTSHVHHSDLLTSQASANSYQSSAFTTNKFANQELTPQHNHRYIPWFAWVFIGSLLLVVGLLGGYIYGNIISANNLPTQIILPQTQVNADFNESNSSELIAPSVSKGASSEPTSTKVNDAFVETTDKVEIALDNDGQMVAKVSQLEQGNVAVIEPVDTKEVTIETITGDDERQNELQQALNEVPDKLKASFADAIKATAKMPVKEENFQVNLSSNDDLVMLDDLTINQAAMLPDMIYQMHIFASDISERWVKINGKTLYEGYELQSGLSLLEIRQNLIVWRLNNTKVGQLALVDFIK